MGNLPPLFLSVTACRSSSLNILQPKPHRRMHQISLWLTRTGWSYKQSCMQETDNKSAILGQLSRHVKNRNFLHWCDETYIYTHIYANTHAFLGCVLHGKPLKEVYSQNYAKWISSVVTKDKRECQLPLSRNCLHQVPYSSSALAKWKVLQVEPMLQNEVP